MWGLVAENHREFAGVMTIVWASATAVMMPVPSVAFVRRRNSPAVAKGFVTEQHLRVAPVMPVVSLLAIAARM